MVYLSEVSKSAHVSVQPPKSAKQRHEEVLKRLTKCAAFYTLSPR
eukprot:gene4749-15061_t